MATHRLSIIDRFLPDTSGSVYWQPSSVLDTNDRFPHEVLVLPDSGTDIAASAQFAVPKNYSSTTTDPTVVIVWRSSATTGDLRVTVATYVASGDNTTSMDPTTDTEASAAVTDTAGGAAMRRMEFSVTLTKANYSADASVLLKLTRTGSNVGDTLAASAIVEDVLFQYADA